MLFIEVTFILDDVENTMIIEREEFIKWWMPHVEIVYIRHLSRAELAAA